MRSKSYRINISPIPWQRVHRENKIYDPHNRDVVAFGICLSNQHNDEPLFEKPVHLDVTFYMPLIKQFDGKKLPSFHSRSPFVDNLYKFLISAMKDVIIADERVICSLSLKKVYDREPRTELIITEVV